RGALWSMYGGLASAIILIAFSGVVSGSETSMIPGVDFSWFPLNNPGIISIPLGFILGWLGTVTSSRREDPAIAAEMDVRSRTGHGAEKATSHSRAGAMAGATRLRDASADRACEVGSTYSKPRDVSIAPGLRHGPRPSTHSYAKASG